MSLCARSCALRSWWNSWWKYRRPYLTLRYSSGLPSSSSTFQFLVVEAPFLVFMVFSQDSVQQRRLPGNALLSGSWSRSLTLILVEVFLVHLLLTLQMSLAKVFFRTFPQIKKSVKVAPHSGSELPPHPSSSTAAAQLEDSVEWVRLKDDKSGKPYYWNRHSFSTVWKPPPGVKVVWNSERNEEGGPLLLALGHACLCV